MSSEFTDEEMIVRMEKFFIFMLSHGYIDYDYDSLIFELTPAGIVNIYEEDIFIATYTPFDGTVYYNFSETKIWYKYSNTIVISIAESYIQRILAMDKYTLGSYNSRIIHGK